MNNFVSFDIFSTPYRNHAEIKISPRSFYIASAIGNEIRPRKGKTDHDCQMALYSSKGQFTPIFFTYLFVFLQNFNLVLESVSKLTNFLRLKVSMRFFSNKAR